LDLSKVEAGRMDIQAEAFPLSGLIDDLRTTFGPLTAEKGLDFMVTIDPSAPAELVTDRQRLRQVLGNLLSNAVKFTERGQVSLLVNASGDDPGTVSFEVTDTGIGIPPQNLETIFGVFQQGDGTLSRRYGGTGLGLSIASEVGALLGGRIAARSDLGHGSTFILRLPAALPAGPRPEPATLPASLPAPVAATPAPTGVSGAGAERGVLVLEGTSGGLLTLLAHSAVSDLAGERGAATVRTVTTADESMAALAETPFRCVVVDLSAPDATGFLERLRETAELRDVPVLAHMARRADSHALNGLTTARSAPAAFEPLPTLDDLRERITLHLSAGGPGEVPPLIGAGPARLGPAAGARASHPALPGKQVLVIDDDVRNVFAITSALELRGMTVSQAADGRSGIDALLATPGTELILMDLMMPGMDGYTTMTAIRQMPQFAELPIVAVTARAMPGDRDKSLSAGATEYVTKPVDTDELVAVIERLLT
ncbi:MAG: response regulator, partial [Trebonia sp.]